MKITLKTTVDVEKEYEVEFPFYRIHDVSDNDFDVIYSKIDSFKPAVSKWSHDTMHITSVQIRSGRGHKEFSYEFEDGSYSFCSSNVDYLLGRGIYSCTADQFNKALAQLKAAVDKAGGGDAE